jgi:O-antigen/teichoic acid export membrane protein
MNEHESSYEWPSQVGLAHRRLSAPRWPDVVVSAFLVLAVAVPTLAVEEDWHGHPMIDEPTHLWVLAACLVAAAFVIGGVVAGHRRPSAAAIVATTAACVAVAVLLACDVLRRLVLVHDGLPIPVVRLWCLGVVTALVLSAAGSMLGRRLTARQH